MRKKDLRGVESVIKETWREETLLFELGLKKRCYLMVYGLMLVDQSLMMVERVQLNEDGMYEQRCRLVCSMSATW